MIHIAARKTDTLGPEGLVHIIGLQKDDLETLIKDGIIQFAVPSCRFAMMYVSVPKDEFIAKLKETFPGTESDAVSTNATPTV